MKAVIQKDQTGCGLACVAMITSRTYDEIKTKANSLGIFTGDERLWSETHYVRRLLKAYSVKISKKEVPFSSWEELPDLALLAIKHRIVNGKPLWHWTVFNRKAEGPSVYDPAAYLDINERTDFNDISPKWFIEIFQKT